MSPSRENEKLLEKLSSPVSERLVSHPGEVAANEQVPSEQGGRNDLEPGDREDKTVASSVLEKVTILEA